jgi:hypothetical protein
MGIHKKLYLFQSVGKEPQMNADKRRFNVLVSAFILKDLTFPIYLMNTLHVLWCLKQINNELKRTDTNSNYYGLYKFVQVNCSFIRYLFQIKKYSEPH